MQIYLDHNAGSPIRPAVRRAIDELLGRTDLGNPASIHRAGQIARRDLETARDKVAALIGAESREIVFTSGGTESNNLAIFGALGIDPRRKRVVTTAIEHSSILEPMLEVVQRGQEAIKISPDTSGLIDPRCVSACINHETALVSVGLVNAEVGAIQELEGIADTAHHVGALVHVDAAQALGRIPVDVNALGCDLMTVSGHKIGTPSGIGALFVRSGVPIASHALGGPQESGRRGGTPNLIGAVAFGVAAQEVARWRDTEVSRIARLARNLLDALMLGIPGLRLNGPQDERVANTLNLCFPGVLGETMLIALDLEGVQVSMGSACAAGSVEPSHVLIAMGRSVAEARSSIRISLGWSTTAEEIAFASEAIPRVWGRIVEAQSARVGELARCARA
jgi:cysteine desulfurase